MSFTKPTNGVTTNYPQQIGRLIDLAEGPAFRNFIRNGDFQIAQRGTSFAGITTAQYCLDGVYHPAAGTQTVSQQAFTVGQTDVPGNPINFLRVQRTVAAGAANAIVQFPVEFPQRLSGKTVTFSFWAKVSSGTKALTLDWVFSGVTPGTYPSTLKSITVTTTWTLFSVTAAVESMTAATANAYIAPRIVESASLGTFTLDVADVQFELGSEATYFERLNYEQQLAWAHRFLPGFKSTGTSAQLVGSGSASSTTAAIVNIPFPVRARAAITGLSVSAASHFTVNDWVATTAANAVTLNIASDVSASVIFGVASGLTQYRPYTAYFNNASGSIVFTGAEL